jgi:hypothetical protein
MGDVSLKKYLIIRLKSLDKATRVAKLEMDRRLEGMNEFREQLNRQAGQFATKDALDAVDKRVQELRETRAASGPMLDIIVKVLVFLMGGYLLYKITTGS